MLQGNGVGILPHRFVSERAAGALCDPAVDLGHEIPKLKLSTVTHTDRDAYASTQVRQQWPVRLN